MDAVEVAEQNLKGVAPDDSVVLQTQVYMLNSMFHIGAYPTPQSLEAVASQAVFRVYRPIPNQWQVLYSARVDASVCRYPDMESALNIIEVKRKSGETMQWRKQVASELVAFLATRTKDLTPEARYNNPPSRSVPLREMSQSTDFRSRRCRMPA
jgi:hypothetical protein